MAQAMGMGVMPWSPLKHGFLSGKFRRDNAGSVDTRRTAMGVPGARRIMSSLKCSAPWPTRSVQHPPPSRWHGSGAAQASHRR
jgi:hypothetical protein